VKFTIVTPTHIKNSYLLDLYTTIRTQTYENWEWVLYLNGGATVNLVEQEIRNDPRVKIFVDNSENNCVGYVKNKAFHLGDGDIIVEVDHDDLLTVNCLEELYKVFQDSSVGFAFSDDAIYNEKDSVQPFNPAYGWTHRKVFVSGDAYGSKPLEMLAHDSFPPSSHSISFIWFAPDHVRAWRRSVYQSIGGHNPELSICDDHELLIRTYLNTKMVHIPKVLYVYRITGNNTWLERNQEIQRTTKELFEKYAWDLACKDAKDQGLMIVDLGGGINPRPGCTTVDLYDADIIGDLNEGIPLPDNSVGVLNASHILEHLNDKHKIMSEIHRVLVDGGWAFIQVPSTDGRGAFQDPTHVSYWNENCFWYYTRKDKAKFIRNETIKFQEFKLNTFWWEPREHNVAVTDAWLVAIKSDKRRPNLVQI
jgi:glycosyltransferase involved in cell wall biosynthesis